MKNGASILRFTTLLWREGPFVKVPGGWSAGEEGRKETELIDDECSTYGERAYI
jgi:hypothetical protein